MHELGATMTTVRQIERLWNAKQYDRLFKQLLASRPEASFRLEIQLGQAVPAAALALIRLDELSQAHVPLCAHLIRAILSAQEADGSWSDPMTTALCLRALLTSHGQGAAIDRGLFYLATMQKSQGIWPKVPIRRMPADPYVSAFILYQLGDCDRFRSAVRFFDAINWFEQNEPNLEPDALTLWRRAALHCRLRPHTANLFSLS
jgi:hypothetical protein